MRAFHSPNAKCYQNGIQYEGGVQKNLSGCGSVDGDVLECVADFLAGRLIWSKKGKVLTECVVPTAMKGRPVYFSVILHWENDVVEITALE